MCSDSTRSVWAVAMVGVFSFGTVGCYQSHLPLTPGIDAGADAPADCGVEICNGRSDDCDAIIDEAAGCPCPVEHREGHAYLFCSMEVGWDDALTACRAVGYELASVEDEGENQWVFSQAIARGGANWYFGLNDRSEEGSWQWTDGRVIAPFIPWAPGEPNRFFVEEDCGDYLPEDGGTWNDEDCTLPQSFICEAGP